MRIRTTGRRGSLLSSVGVAAVIVSAACGIGAYGAGSAFGSASGQAPPVGHYGCYAAPVPTPGGPGYGSNIYRNRVAEGDVWIDSDHEYAGPNFKNDMGTYVMDGRTLVAKSGAFALPGHKTRITFTPAQGNNKASLYVVYYDDKGQPSRGSECVWSDPLQ